ncbi:hypothetical protein [Anaeromyxobacter diazotrophicus]|uniref:Lipoprotein n=1 Tax=Anaeromyxobacter diazotrophicus TaxID=2590199 RepID=A0A7I9VSE7_9BACT|nr:hypothetical protein [Anaeromyxobacter diazotrophicus]GEJ59138.1 hypothetical protein AMYX_38790 [Anaeromyxobacter diazotrophicus]
MAARSRIAALLLPFVAAACHDAQRSVPPTMDRFYYPTGLAVRHAPATCVAGTAGCQSQLLVASSNFDLRYDAITGGTVLAVDVDRALGGVPNAAAGPFLPGAILGSTRIGSFAGEVAYVDEASCPGWGKAPQVLVTSRAQNVLYRLDVDASTGALSCGAGCELPLAPTLADGYGVTVVCGDLAAAGGGATQPRHLAFVTYLRSPSSEGFLSRIDLDSGAIEATYDVGIEPTQSTAFDEGRGLLFVSERFATVGMARLRWIDLAFPQLGSGSVDYGQVVRGAELVTLGLSSDSPPSRAYVAARLFDVDTATSSGLRPVGDVGGALLVLDLKAVLAGAPAAETILDVAHLDRGPTALAVVPKLDAAGKPQVDASGVPLDLVVLTSSDDGSMTFYDDQLGQPVAAFSVCGSGASGDARAPGPCPLGAPVLGKQPFGLAYEPYQLGGKSLARLFVGSFDRGWVNAIVFDPAHPDALDSSSFSWARIGPERQ